MSNGTWICTACNEQRHKDYDKVCFGWSEAFPNKYYGDVCADCAITWIQKLSGVYKTRDEMLNESR